MLVMVLGLVLVGLLLPRLYFFFSFFFSFSFSFSFSFLFYPPLIFFAPFFLTPLFLVWLLQGSPVSPLQLVLALLSSLWLLPLLLVEKW